jgi:hypothetical protein
VIRDCSRRGEGQVSNYLLVAGRGLFTNDEADSLARLLRQWPHSDEPPKLTLVLHTGEHRTDADGVQRL